VTTPLICSVVHSIPGRVRLRVPALKTLEPLGLKLVDYCRDLEGVTEADCNRTCASLILVYDANRWTGESLHVHVSQLSWERLAAYIPTARPKRGGLAAAGPSAVELVLSSAGIALTVLVEGATRSLAPLLLLASALPMLSRAFAAYTRENRLNVDVLDASAMSLLSVQGDVRMALFMVWLVNLGDYIRDATMMKAQQAVHEVLAYRTCLVWVLRGDLKVRVSVEDVRIGDTLVVYPGERIAVDGVVLSGKAAVDQRALTGESMPVEKEAGDLVYAATVVQAGKLYIRAERIGDQTEAARIVQMVEEAPVHETRIQNYAERWADELVPYSFAGAGAAGLLSGNVSRMASVLIIDYGTGIRIAAPTTVLASMTRGLRRGILIKGGRHMERLAKVDAVVFDKTGTLTVGQPEVLKVIAYAGHSEEEVLSVAAGSEQRLTHPVAQAIVRAAEARGLSLPTRDSSEYHIGLGVEAEINGSQVLVGSARFVGSRNVMLTSPVQEDFASIEESALSPVCVAVNGQVIGLLAYTDPPRQEAADVVHTLREMGIKEVVMLTGDHRGVAAHVARTVGVDHYVGEALPADKVAAVKDLQARGYTVAVVGDGINDSPALAHADVGIAVHGGTEVAQETAHVVLLRGGLWKIPLAIQIGRDAMHLIQQNWTLISVPNTIALGLACWGLLGPGTTTLLSNGSAVLASGNALRPLLNGSVKSVQRRARIARSRATSATD
jgi:P-type Cu2+ transporter